MGFWRGVRDVLVGRYDSDPVSISSSDQLPQLIRRMWGSDDMGRPVSRSVALSVPAVARHHKLVASSVATLPLRELDEQHRAHKSPLLKQIDPDVPNVVTLAQTLEDLVFDAISWWQITERDGDGFPTSARRLAPGVVHLQPRPGNDRTPAPLPGGEDPRDQVVYLEGKVATGETLRSLIRFDSPEPPLLVVGARTIRRALLLDSLAETYADNPRPLDYFTPKENADPLQDDEVVDMLDTWAENRRRRSTAYVPAAVEYVSVDQPTPADLQLVPLQQRVSLDLANMLGIDPEDLGISTTSRTYQNATDRRKDRINDTLSPYMLALTQRLSMGDITRSDRRVELDLDDYLRADPATRSAYYKVLAELGAIDPDEIRDRERLGPRRPGARPVLRALPGGREAAGFAADDRVVELDFAAAPPVVDFERRTITGRVVPYGEVAVKGGRRFEFLPGSLAYTELSRNKMLRDHDQSQAFGVLTADDERHDGRYATYRVAPGDFGDQMLALAASGVYDGLSPGVEFDIDRDADLVHGVYRVRRATWRETSLVAMPAFDGSRVTSVTATRDQGDQDMPCQTCGQTHAEGVACPTPAAPPAATEPLTAPAVEQFSADQVRAMFAAAGINPPAPRETPTVVNPARPAPDAGAAQVTEPLPYRLSLARDAAAVNGMRYVFAEGPQGYDFSTDVLSILRGVRQGLDTTDAQDRVGALIRAQFDVDRADTAALSPTVHRPDLWVPQLDFATPLWDMIAAGTTDGRTFDLPKFNSASGMVGPATEGVEPSPGAMTVTDQTVTPSQVWGKVEITRQAMRRTGSPQLSGILWEQMLREYYEDREAAVATFLATLTAAADITLTGTPAASPTNANDQQTMTDLEAALTDLLFVRGGNRFRAFAVHQALYRVMTRVKDSTGRPLYPQINPQNANGTVSSLYRVTNIGGVTAVPAWALGTPGTAATNSWLFDPSRTLGWASAPERLDWNFGATVQQISGATGNVPQLSHVTVGIYGDVAFANLDINSVRQVIFDPSV